MRTTRLVATIVALLTLAVPSFAIASSSVLTDPTGDAAAGSPDYVDIAQARVTDQIGTGTFVFSMVLAAPIPAEPPDSFLAYNWFIDTGGTTAFDYVIVVRWCTERTAPPCAAGPLPRWEAFVNDFIHPVTYFSSFAVDGAAVRASVDGSLIGSPTAFTWRTLSRTMPAAAGAPPVDFAPDTDRMTFAR
ncbi:MAG TPA: hypothetical protein VGK07_01255 [Candidatus Limnocylindria bacterium]